MKAVLQSGRWAISGPYCDEPLRERQFAEAFAAFNRAKYCVPCSSGTAALMIALEAAGIGYGDEVLVPGLTWVATASAVLGVNAIPILVDIDPDTWCMDPSAVERSITSRTKAILTVHLYSSMANMERLFAIAAENGILLIEDCAQAHGAQWRGRSAGTIGLLGTFSFQQEKVLTSGEGGAVLTNSIEMYRRLQQLRADGRSYADAPPHPGDLELVETGELQGSNRCLSEIHAALLLDQLPLLSEQNAHREQNARFLDDALVGIGGYIPQAAYGHNSKRTHYQYALRLDPSAFEGIPCSRVADALSIEVNIRVRQGYPPLNNNRLYCPHTRRRFQLPENFLERVKPADQQLPVATRIHQAMITLHHSVLLGDLSHVQMLAAAFEKIRRRSDDLRAS